MSGPPSAPRVDQPSGSQLEPKPLHRNRQSRGARILVVEDDPSLMRALRTKLSRRHYTVEVVSSGPRALAAFERFRPDLVLFDVDESRPTDSAFISDVRSRGVAPLIVVSARAVERDTVSALELGADDFVTKPLAFEELLARIRVALRHVARPSKGSDALVRFGDIEVDVEQRRVVRGGRQVYLTPTEYDLLKQFIVFPDRLLTDQVLLERVWGKHRKPGEHALHVYVARLRKKIERDPQAPAYLITEVGAGYRLVVEPHEQPAQLGSC